MVVPRAAVYCRNNQSDTGGDKVDGLALFSRVQKEWKGFVLRVHGRFHARGRGEEPGNEWVRVVEERTL